MIFGFNVFSSFGVNNITRSLLGHRRKAYNGYTLFWSQMIADRLPLAGETQDMCRKRVMTWCNSEWKRSEELRAYWSQRAKELNLELKAQRRYHEFLAECQQAARSTEPAQPHRSDQHPLCALVARVSAASDSTHALVAVPDDTEDSMNGRFGQLCVAALDSDEEDKDKDNHFGAFGLGDNNWALSEKTLAQADCETGFVKTWASKWRHRSAGMIPDSGRFSSTTSRLSCFESLGFCVSEIQSMPKYKHVLEQLRQHVSNHRRLHLVGRRNKGPNVKIPHALLILKSSHEFSGQSYNLYRIVSLRFSLCVCMRGAGRNNNWFIRVL